MIKTVLTLIGAAILAFGLVTGSPPKAKAQEAAASSSRPGDDQLSCPQLAAESAALQAGMDGMTREIQSASADQIRAARSTQSAATASAMASSLASSIPFIGGLIGSIASRAATAGMEAQQDHILELSERMMTRGTEIGSRLQRVEILRAARCGTGQGASGIAAAAPEPVSPGGSASDPGPAGT